MFSKCSHTDVTQDNQEHQKKSVIWRLTVPSDTKSTNLAEGINLNKYFYGFPSNKYLLKVLIKLIKPEF